MYYFQLGVVGVVDDRPEYDERPKNKSWTTLFEADNADDLLCLISDWLNDENYPTDQWTRIVKDNVVLQSGLLI